MANSPVPACYPSYYYDVEVDYLGYEAAEEENKGYKNTAHLKNVGQGYLTYNISVGKKQKDSSIGYGSLKTDDEPLFGETVYGPGSEFDFTFYSDNIIPNPSKLVYTCRAYSNIDKAATVEGNLCVKLDYSYHSSTSEYIENYYEIEAELKGTNDNYYYGVIFDLNYKGTSYYVFVQNYRFNFVAFEDLDLNQLTVSVKDVVKYDWNDEYGLFGGCNTDLNSLLGGFLIVLLVMSAIIFLSIFLPITLTRAARRRRQRAREAVANEKKD